MNTVFKWLQGTREAFFKRVPGTHEGFLEVATRNPWKLLTRGYQEPEEALYN